MKKNFYLLMGMAGGILLGGQSVQAAPLTKTQVSRPTTTQTVHQSFTQTAVTRPVTNSAVVQPPMTDIAVVKPLTTTIVEHPTTSSVVSHPQTDAPNSVSATNNTNSPFSGTLSVQKRSPGETNSVNKSSMDDTSFLPKPTNFKAAKLGGGEEGLGKLNYAEKEAAAKSFELPKGEEVSLENVLKSDGNTANLKKKVEKKVDQKS